MESFSSFFQAQSAAAGSWSYESLKNFRQISPAVQNHLKQVTVLPNFHADSSSFANFDSRIVLLFFFFYAGFIDVGLSLANLVPVYRFLEFLVLRFVASLNLESLRFGRLPLLLLPRADSTYNWGFVYFTLCCALVASAVGAYLHILWNIGGLLTTIGCMGSIIWLLSTPVYQEQKRVGLLMASALFEGASVGPLISFAIDFDPSIVVSAFVGTAIAFGCFSAAAVVARRREYLYLSGLLSSGLSILFWLQFASSIFGGSTAMFKFELYFGLLVFLGYMVVDTQEIIERAHLGDMDYVKHALTLFTDFAAVFVRILVILLKNTSEKEKKRKRRD
ncbi:Bax inhibitor 1 [Asimina triloba]